MITLRPLHHIPALAAGLVFLAGCPTSARSTLPGHPRQDKTHGFVSDSSGPATGFAIRPGLMRHDNDTDESPDSSRALIDSEHTGRKDMGVRPPPGPPPARVSKRAPTTGSPGRPQRHVNARAQQAQRGGRKADRSTGSLQPRLRQKSSHGGLHQNPARPTTGKQPPAGPRAVGRIHPARPYIALLAPGRLAGESLSIGRCSSGKLLGAVALPLDTKDLFVLPNCRKRHTNFGTRDLVSLLEYAAAQVHARFSDTKMAVCNMSRRDGGRIQWSRSHQGGRDADVAFFVTRHGKPVSAPSLIKFGPDLTAPGGYRFDLARNWTLVRALITHPTIRVQWIFAARFLKRALLDYALAHEKKHDLVVRAAHVLHQPGDSLSHDDHFHIRIYCSKKDVLEGCIDFGPRWPWVPTYDRAKEHRIRILMSGLRDPKESVRLASLNFLIRLEARTHLGDILRVTLADPAHSVRMKALDMLASWRPRGGKAIDVFLAYLSHRCPIPPGRRGHGTRKFQDGIQSGSSLETHRSIPDQSIAPETPLRARSSQRKMPNHYRPLSPSCPRDKIEFLRAYGVLGQLGTHAALPMLVRMMRRDSPHILPSGEKVDDRLTALHAATSILDRRLVPGLLAALDSDDPTHRRLAAVIMRKLFNRSFGYNWPAMRSKRSRRRALVRWRKWWHRTRKLSRKAVVLAGFRKFKYLRRNLRIPSSMRGLSTLVSLTKRRDQMGFNASWLLTKLCKCHGGHGLPAPRRHEVWAKWLARVRAERKARRKALRHRRRRLKTRANPKYRR